MKRKSATYRDSTLRTQRIREQAARMYTRNAEQRDRDQQGRFSRNQGLQMKADMKVVTNEQKTERVIATRNLHSEKEYITEDMICYTQEQPEAWDAWATQATDSVSESTGEKRKILLTTMSRPPSRITNEAMFAIERTEHEEEANAQLTIASSSSSRSGYTAKLIIRRNIKRGERLLAFRKD